MIVVSDGYRFDFTDAIVAFKFDEIDKTKSTYHGVTALKAVDVFVEIKELDKPDAYNEAMGMDLADIKTRRDHFTWLKNYLKYKFRDTILYRYAENKLDKQVKFLCLLNFDNALNFKTGQTLNRELPVGRKSQRWKIELATGCLSLNLKKWNELFPLWPAERI